MSLHDEICKIIPASKMTLRDSFAAACLPSHVEAISGIALPPEDWHNEVARLCYATADAMLKARAR